MNFNLKQILFAVVAILFVACDPGNQPPTGKDDKPDSELDTTIQFAMQYCEDTILTALGQDYSSTVYEQSAAIKLTEAQLRGFAFNRVIKMSVGLHGMDDNAVSTEYSNLKFWIREELDGENIWSQDYTGDIKLKEWNEIVMSPYLKLTPNTYDLYFGYTIEANGLIIGCDGSQAPTKAGCYIYDCDSRRWIQHTELGNMCIKCVISGENMPQNDAALVAIETAEYVKPNKAYTLVATVENKAMSPLNSFDFVVKSGKDEYHVENIVLASALERGEKYTFFVNDVRLSKAGTIDVEYAVENVNGVETDDNVSDNVIVVKTVVADNLVDRVVLLENTTGDMCSNCPAGHNYIDAAMKEVGEDKFIWMAHHAGYNAGKYTSNQSDSIASLFYATTMTYAPGLMIDRTNLLAVGVTTSQPTGGPIFSVNEVASRGVLDDYFRLMQSDMAPIALDVQHTFDAATRNLSVTVKGDILAEIADREHLAVGIALLEDNLEGTQAGVAGKYYHNHVCRDALTSILGTLVGGSGNSFEFTTSKVLNSKYVPENVSIVVWVANKPTNKSNYDDYKVYQSYKFKLVK
jgi:hypothetical protein